jgi:hypothetical protein
MLKGQLMQPWEKSIPESIIDRKTAKTEARPKNKTASFLRLFFKAEVI